MVRYYVQLDGNELAFDVSEGAGGTVLGAAGSCFEGTQVVADLAPVHASVETGEGLYSLLADGHSYQLYVQRSEEGYRLVISRHRFDFTVLTEREWRLRKVAPRQATGTGATVLAAPMPGLVKAMLVVQGDEVEKGQRLVVLEAMKMENDLTAPRAGKVGKIHVSAGTIVDGGKPLVTLE